MPYKDPKLRKEKQRGYAKKYYEGNKVAVKAATKEVNKRAQAEWNAYKATLSCTKCGQNHPAALDFHHPPGTKENSVFYFIQRRRYKRAFLEAAKCIVLCASCHRIHHYEENKAAKKTKKKRKKGTEHP